MNRPSTEKWNISARLSPLLGGHRNKVFRTTGLGRDVVFKSTRRSANAIAWLADVQDCARQAGFVVPHYIKSRAGSLIEDGWSCEEFIDGQHIDAAEMRHIRPQLLRFHAIAADLEQRPGFLSSSALRQFPSGGDVDLEQMPDKLARECRDAWDAVADRQEGIIHGDLNTGNVLRQSDGRYVLLDWDESRRDLLLFDLGQIEEDDNAGARARLAWEIACSWVVEPDHARSLASQL